MQIMNRYHVFLRHKNNKNLLYIRSYLELFLDYVALIMDGCGEIFKIIFHNLQLYMSICLFVCLLDGV